MKLDKPIYVTQPSLPELDDFIPYLKEIWDSRILTNNGKFHQVLEEELAMFLGVKYVSLFANATLALLTSMQALRITGEVITTPYTFVATSNSLIWNNLKPVFVDINPHTCNIDADKIEDAITSNTTAILPVHVYGNPCEVYKIQELADIYNLKVVYDAAHAFGVNYKGTSILNYGDLSVLSFHATKVFNTMEGGAIISHNAKTKKRIDYLKNFGIMDEVKVIAPGINSKMNEMQAALGILQLKDIRENILRRKEIADTYTSAFSLIKGISVLTIVNEVEDFNYSYYPIFIEEEYGKSRNEVYDFLKSYNIFGRRYFYPLVTHFPIYKNKKSSNPSDLIVAEDIANKVICLPIYPNLQKEIVYKIISILKR